MIPPARRARADNAVCASGQVAIDMNEFDATSCEAYRRALRDALVKPFRVSVIARGFSFGWPAGAIDTLTRHLVGPSPRRNRPQGAGVHAAVAQVNTMPRSIRW
jgi:hypothetical protein